MAKQLEDLVSDRFKDMTFEEKLRFIAKVRKSRMTPKATSKVVKKSKKVIEKRKEKFDDLFSKLSEEERLALLGGINGDAK